MGEWFKTRLSNTAAMDGLPRVPAVVKRPAGLDPRREAWIVGHAFDWRLQLGLSDDIGRGALDGAAQAASRGVGTTWRDVVSADAVPADAQGVKMTAAGTLRYRPAGADVDHHARVSALLNSVEPGRPATSDDERRIAAISVVLGLYESLARQWDVPELLDRLVAGTATPEEMVEAVPDVMVDDVDALARAARAGLASLFPHQSLECNPVVGTRWLLGDGDLLIDGTLIELKVVARASIKPQWLWQLIGYVLLDNGTRTIDRVAIYLARHGHLAVWTVDELIATLAGGSVDRSMLRDELVEAAGAGGRA